MSGAGVKGRLRAIGLSLPDATLDEGHPPHLAFKVGGKAFAWYTENEHGNGRIELHVRAEPGVNNALIASDPDRFSRPKYMARFGWVSYYLDLPKRKVDWDEVSELLRDSYRLQAPKRLARLVD